MIELLKEQLTKNNILYDEDKVNKIINYNNILLDYNKKYNLTAITNEDDLVIKHYIDSLSLLKTNYTLENKKIIDLGTGAGFPGIPLSIFINTSFFTLVDSLQKRINFLSEVVKELKLNNVELIHSRIEDLAHNLDYREKYDYVISRAVSNLPVLAEYMLPFCKIQGLAIAYKANIDFKELESSQKAFSLLGGLHPEKNIIKLTDTEYNRCFIISNKINKTPFLYPRKAGTITKKPII